jgi:lipopolysaccharide/colanic/teichoic acid biosynthesis glycosyltransferase
MGILAILIKVTSPGRSFINKTNGLDGRVFYMYKFRSMRVDAEKKSELSGPKSTIPAHKTRGFYALYQFR